MDIDIDMDVDVEVKVDVNVDRYFGFEKVKGGSKSVQVLSNGIEADIVLSSLILK